MKQHTPAEPPAHQPFKIDYRRELNDEQLEVVMSDESPLLVIAGAGSGKTRTLTYRVARLMESGTPPDAILLLTFTNKAAKEMLGRVEGLIRLDIARLWGGTFHHVANRILRSRGDLIGYDRSFTILDRDDSRELLGDCMAGLGLKSRDRRFPQSSVIQEIISLSVNTRTSLPDLIDARYPFFMDATDDIQSVALAYRERKKKEMLMDFDDLLLNCLTLLAEHDPVRDYYAGRFHHILVDEYQDTNRIQAEMIDLLASGGGSIMVVGDDSQSIYSFRGAHFANILDFPKRYPGSHLFKLQTNYRSTPEILGLANASIVNNQHQFHKKLRAIRESGLQPILVPCDHAQQQSGFVRQKIMELQVEGRSLNEIAVLYRAHYHSMELQMELTRHGVPFEVRSGLRFFEQAHIKDITSYLKIIVNPYDEPSWKRITKMLPKIGTARAEKIWTALSSSGDPLKNLQSEAIEKLIPRPYRKDWQERAALLRHLNLPERRGAPAEMLQTVLRQEYEDYLFAHYPDSRTRLEDIGRLIDFSRQFGSAEDFLSELALLTSVASEDVTADDPGYERVTLTTIHQAKGLEWDVVFIIWLVEGRFPSHKSLQDIEGEEEERRLFYVAATRARDELYLTYPLWDYARGDLSPLMQPSRFVQEIPRARYTKCVLEE